MNPAFSALVSAVLESFSDSPDVFLLQIGAGDGMAGDFLHPYLTSKRWRALLLEPHGPAFARLCTTYRDFPSIQCQQTAISGQDGFEDFYAVRDTEGLPWWTTQIQSLKLDVILSHEAEIPGLAELLEIQSIPCLSVASLMASHSIDHANIVAIDTEGLDAVIVSDVLNAGLKPELLLFEHKHLLQGERQRLLRQLCANYTIIEGPYDTLCTRKHSCCEKSLLSQTAGGRNPESD